MRREEWFRLPGDILRPNDGRQLQLENQSGVSRIHISPYTHGASVELISESHSQYNKNVIDIMFPRERRLNSTHSTTKKAQTLCFSENEANSIMPVTHSTTKT